MPPPRCLPLVLLAITTILQADPGQGAPLELSPGRVHEVSDTRGLFQALDSANRQKKPATILIANGTYVLPGRVLVVQCPGLVVRGASGERDKVILRGPDGGPRAKLAHVFLVGANDVTIADLTLGWVRNHGIQIQGEKQVSGTRVHNCRLVNCNEQFIKGSGGRGQTLGAMNGRIEHCTFEFTSGWAYQYYTGGIDIHRGVNWTVRHNLFRNIRTPSAQKGIAEHAIHFWKRADKPQNLVIEHNLIIDCDRGIGLGLGSFEGGCKGGKSVIRNNRVCNDGTGKHTDVGIGLEHASGVVVEHNTVFIPTYWAPIELRFKSSKDVVFRNNLSNRPIARRNEPPPAEMSGNVGNAEGSWFRDAAKGDLRLKPGRELKAGAR